MTNFNHKNSVDIKSQKMRLFLIALFANALIMYYSITNIATNSFDLIVAILIFVLFQIPVIIFIYNYIIYRS